MTQQRIEIALKGKASRADSTRPKVGEVRVVSRDIQTEFAAMALKGQLLECPACGQATHQVPLRGTWSSMLRTAA